MPTAFVLSGGASLGAEQVGMLRALVERGIMPDLIVGSSVGAINGAWLAGRPDAAGVEELATIWRSIRRQDVFPVHLLPPLCPLSVSPADFSHSQGLIERAHAASREWLEAGPPTQQQHDLLGFHHHAGQTGHTAATWARSPR
jgi:predicted acylesterase/phospholipase RssA